MSHETPESVEEFFQALSLQGAADLTIRNYRSDLVHFVRWFAGSTAEPFSPAAITPTDIRDYRSHLLNVERRAPATIQRRLPPCANFASGLWRRSRSPKIRPRVLKAWRRSPELPGGSRRKTWIDCSEL